MGFIGSTCTAVPSLAALYDLIAVEVVAGHQGLTLVHFPAQRKHFLWNTLVGWLPRLVTKAAQDEVKSGRV